MQLLEISVEYSTYWGWQGPERDYTEFPDPGDLAEYSFVISETETGFEIGNLYGAFATGENLLGEYLHVDNPLLYRIIVSEVFSGPKSEKDHGRRPSIYLTKGDEATINHIAQTVGATYNGAGTWRKIIRGLLKGSLQVTRKSQHKRKSWMDNQRRM